MTLSLLTLPWGLFAAKTSLAEFIILSLKEQKGYKTVRCASKVLFGSQQEANLIQFLDLIKRKFFDSVWKFIASLQIET